MTCLETPRLLLRRWRDDDLNVFSALNADARVMRYFPAPLTAAQSEAFLTRIRAEFTTEGFGLYALECKQDGRFVGFTGLHRVTCEGALHGRVELSYRLCAQEWGHGYATEAAKACVAHAAQLGISELVAFTFVGNLPSQRVMQRIGMEPQGEFDHPALPVGDPLLRHVLYRIRTT